MASAVVPDAVAAPRRDTYSLAPVDWEDEDRAEDEVAVRDDTLTHIIESVNTAHRFGNVNVAESTEVHFGNKTFIHGPVTIKQFISAAKSADGEKAPAEEGAPNGASNGAPNGLDNPSFVDDEAKEETRRFGVLAHMKSLKNQCSNNKKAYLFGLFFGIFVIIALVFLIRMMKNDIQLTRIDDENLVKNTPIKTDIDKVLIISKSLRTVSRLEWLAQPPSGTVDVQSGPVHIVVIAHTATESCTDQASCTFQVRNMQTYHIESRHWSDIGYNFLVGGDGSAYEGRGWGKIGAHTKGYNNDSICIAFIGTFNTVTPPERQLLAATRLIELGVANGGIDKNYKLYGHRQLVPFLSPGDALYAIIKTWPHFDNSKTQVN